MPSSAHIQVACIVPMFLSLSLVPGGRGVDLRIGGQDLVEATSRAGPGRSALLAVIYHPGLGMWGDGYVGQGGEK